MKKILHWLDENLEKSILLVLLCGMVISLSIQIIARFVFDHPLSWSEELARYLFVWSGFLSISYCIKTNIAIRIDQAVNFLPEKAHFFMNCLVYLILMAYFIYMIPYAYDFFYRAYAAKQTMPALQAPIAIVYFSPFFGFVLAVIRLIQNLIKDIRAFFAKTEIQKEGE